MGGSPSAFTKLNKKQLKIKIYEKYTKILLTVLPTLVTLVRDTVLPMRSKLSGYERNLVLNTLKTDCTFHCQCHISRERHCNLRKYNRSVPAI